MVVAQPESLDHIARAPARGGFKLALRPSMGPNLYRISIYLGDPESSRNLINLLGESIPTVNADRYERNRMPVKCVASDCGIKVTN